MPDPIEELARYGAAVEATMPATAVEELVAGGALSGGAATDEVILDAPSSDAGRNRRPWLIAAAVAAIVALGATALVTRPDDEDTDDLEVVDDPAGETFGYGPGWHELDPGPLSPRRGASVTWTGEELIVLGGESETDGAAYDPGGREWRTLPPPPLELPTTDDPEDPGPSAAWSTAWTGEELIVVVRSGVFLVSNPPQRGGQAAAYNPEADSWRSLPPPPMWLLTSSSDAVWTGDEAIFLDVLAAYSPLTDAWRELPPPSASFSVPRGLADAYAGTWTGTHLVFAAPGEPTVAYDPVTDSWVEHEPAPLLDVEDREELPLERAPTAGIGSTGDLAAMTTCAGDGAALDLTTWAWTERDLPLDISVDCRPTMWSLGGRLVTDLRTGRFLLHDGRWQRFDVEGWVPTQGGSTASTGDVLFSWASTEVVGLGQSTSTVVQSSPTFGLFVPPWISEREAPPITHAPTDTVVSPTTTATYLRARAGEAELLLAPVEIQCLSVATDPCVEDVPWADDGPLIAEPGTPLEISISDDNWTMGDIYLQQAVLEDGECVSETIHVGGDDSGLGTSQPWIQAVQAIPPGSHRVLATARSGDVQGVYQFAIESGPDPRCPPPTGPFAPPIGADPGPAITVIAGEVEGSVAPVGGYCWIDDMLERCATDPTSETDVDRVLTVEPGGQLHAVLPEDGTIRFDLPWDASGEECGRLERTVPAEASTPTLITGTIPPGTHTLAFDVTIGDDTQRYEVTLQAGTGPRCAVAPPTSQARLLPDFELFGLTREELATEYGDWRDVTHGRDDRPRLLELDVAFEDGRVRFADISFSGRTPILEGVEELEDLPYLGLTIEEAQDLARSEGREYCVWLQACRANLDRSRLQFHTAEVGDETRVVGIYRS